MKAQVNAVTRLFEPAETHKQTHTIQLNLVVQ